MARKKTSAPTKTLSFRVDANIYDRIVEAAKSQNISLGDYILGQVMPTSELGGIIQAEQSKILLQDEIIRTGLANALSDLVQIKERNGLDNESLMQALKGSIDLMVKGKSTSK